MSNFAQSLLIEMLGTKLLLHPEHAREVKNGIEFALAEGFSSEGKSEELPLKNLVEALEKVGLPEEVGVVNVLKLPLTPLWLRGVLLDERRRLSGRKEATVLIVGLWEALGCARVESRNNKAEAHFAYWRNFIEEHLCALGKGKLTILFVG